ncbi:tyrosine-protein phosphatase [Yinghuangia aomiensis]
MAGDRPAPAAVAGEARGRGRRRGGERGGDRARGGARRGRRHIVGPGRCPRRGHGLGPGDGGRARAGRLYLAMAERGRDAFARALELLVGDAAGPTLVHCTAGKDRTGVLVALLMSAVGVDRAAIVADYAATRIHIDEMFRRIDAIANQPRLKPGTPAAAALRDAAPESMEAFLDAVLERYGSAGEFFVKAGARPEWLEIWRERFVAA